MKLERSESRMKFPSCHDPTFKVEKTDMAVLMRDADIAVRYPLPIAAEIESSRQCRHLTRRACRGEGKEFVLLSLLATILWCNAVHMRSRPLTQRRFQNIPAHWPPFVYISASHMLDPQRRFISKSSVWALLLCTPTARSSTCIR